MKRIGLSKTLGPLGVLVVSGFFYLTFFEGLSSNSKPQVSTGVFLNSSSFLSSKTTSEEPVSSTQANSNPLAEIFNKLKEFFVSLSQKGFQALTSAVSFAKTVLWEPLKTLWNLFQKTQEATSSSRNSSQN